MKERSIRFSDTEVRAILEGRKTQARRVVKCHGQWTCECPDSDEPWPYFENELGEWEFFECPHGTMGDRLWVREAFCADFKPLIYRASATSDTYGGEKIKYRPSIHMPRWASRMTLEITDVRVERLQEISEEDAIAEGVSEIIVPGIEYGPYGDPVQPLDCSATDRDRFYHLWQSIHHGAEWSANPWVWVIEFRRVDNG